MSLYELQLAIVKTFKGLIQLSFPSHSLKSNLPVSFLLVHTVLLISHATPWHVESELFSSSNFMLSFRGLI